MRCVILKKMMKNVKHIKFQNRTNSNAQFDIVKLAQLFEGEFLDHSIEEHHKVDFFVILFIEEGTGYHTIDFIDYPCSKGTLLTLRKDQIHKFCKNDKLRGSLLVFTDEFLVDYLVTAQLQQSLLLFNESLGNSKIQLNDAEFKDVNNLINHIKIEYFEIKDVFQMGIIRSALHILITKLFRIKVQKEKIDFQRKYIKGFIEVQKLMEANITKTKKVKDYAQWMGMSTKTLNNIIRNAVHKSAKEFVDEICIRQIKRLLKNTELSIKEIAYQSGFEEITNFYKYFSRHTDTTPEKFRANR